MSLPSSWSPSLIPVQLLPLLLVFALSLLLLLLVKSDKYNYLIWSTAMALENIGLGFPWSWVNTRASAFVAGTVNEKRKRSSHARSSASAPNGSAKHGRSLYLHLHTSGITVHADTHKPEGPDDGYFPGLVNISGTYCFMNSTIQVGVVICQAELMPINSMNQAIASLCYLQPHIEATHAKAEALDVPTPVIDALRDLLHCKPLNRPF